MDLAGNYHSAAAGPWAECHFGEADLSDVRRVERVRMIAEAMAAQPGRSLPQLFARWYDVKAAYELFQHEEASPDNRQAGHREWVLDVMSEPGTYLLLEDTSDMVWAGHPPVAGLGPVGQNTEVADGLQGFLLHSVLGVRWPAGAAANEKGKRPAVQVVGLADQYYQVRQPRPVAEPRGNSRVRKGRARESQVWEQASYRVGPAPGAADVRWVSVADRGADIYEYLVSKQELRQGYVVRACQNRVLVDPGTGRRASSLFPILRQATAWGTFALELRARPGQAARTATRSVGAVAVGLRAPQRPGHAAGTLPPIRCWAVRVWEASPPRGVAALEWMLLCDAPIQTLASAWEVARQYAARWLVEDYHKALKTGMGAERLQLETADGLFAAIAIMSVVALRLIDLRERVRVQPEAPAEASGLSALELQVLGLQLQRPLCTVRAVALGIGRLGGHLNRKGDGLPGWITLWRGMSRLRLLVDGVRLAQKVKRFG